MSAVTAWASRYRIPLVVAAVIVLAIASSRIVGGLTEYRLMVPLDSADGLYPGSDVLIAGAKAGSVSDITLEGGQTLVTLTLGDAYAPVHSDAKVTVRPKSLLGEKYVALDPGTRDVLQSGSRLPEEQVARSVELQDVVNTLDQPTREKLRTLVIELGGGLAGQGPNTNQTIAYGRQDMDHLAAISDTLAARDADLEQVIQGLDQVTAELARSDRRQQLGALIQNTQTLLHSLSLQDAQIKQTLVQANAALGRTDTSLTGTASQLNHIFQQAPRTVDLLNGLSADLGSGMDQILKGNNLRTFDAGMKYSSNVFGGSASDGSGYATRITVTVGGCSLGIPCTVPVDTGFKPLRPVPDAFDAAIGVLLGVPK
ncbi:MAG TPA: MlaD family protein [Candidatus Dormibacteraeota bacterium]|jgi:phospholipid/cholesterol/gamma-HCH transport system substrate-binding protein